jgi:hypothetical protein
VTGGIIGGVVGFAILLASIFLVPWYLKRSKSRTQVIICRIYFEKIITIRFCYYSGQVLVVIGKHSRGVAFSFAGKFNHHSFKSRVNQRKKNVGRRE